MTEDIVALFIPIGICVIVPIAIVWIVFKTFMNKDNRRTEVLIEAIKSNNDIDTDKLAETMADRGRTPEEILNLRLLRGCIFSLAGLAVLGAILFFYFNNEYIEDECIGLFLIAGLISVAIGISYLIVYYVTRKTTDKD